MANLEKIWIETNAINHEKSIRVDWDNNRHQRIEIKGETPTHVIAAFKIAAIELERELSLGEI